MPLFSLPGLANGSFSPFTVGVLRDARKPGSLAGFVAFG